MTLQAILKRFEGKEFETVIKRRAWATEKQPYQNCYCSSGCFYTSPDFAEEYCKPFPFDVEDILANDWEYQEQVWVTK